MAIGLQSVVEVSVQGIAAGQAIVNVLHYQPLTTNPNFNSTVIQCLTAFRTAFRTAVLPALVNDYTVLRYVGRVIRGTRVDPNNPNKFILDIGDEDELAGVPASDIGGGTLDPLPTYVAMTVKKLTGIGGKRKRGSSRWGPFQESFTEPLDPNKLTAAGKTAADAIAAFVFTTLNSAVAGDTLKPVVLSRADLFKPPQPTIGAVPSATPIITAIANSFVGSQVSRKQRASFGA